MGGTATDGRCGSDCDLLVPFLLVLFLMMFATFLNNIPATTVVLKAVPHAQRTLAMGLQNFIFRLLGAVPAPLVFGALVDSACVLRERRCGADGGCLEYDNWQLRVTFVLLGLVPKAAACACYALGWWHFDSPYEDDDNDDGFDADTQQAGVGTGPGAGEVELGQLSALQQ
jgi:MFS family permease